MNHDQNSLIMNGMQFQSFPISTVQLYCLRTVEIGQVIGKEMYTV